MFDVGIFDVTNDELMMLDEPPPSFDRKSPKTTSANRVDKKVSGVLFVDVFVCRPFGVEYVVNIYTPP
jgi:hypothetical protein